MGWLYYAPTRKELVSDLIAPSTWTNSKGETVTRTTVKKRQFGNRLWALHTVTIAGGPPVKFVVLYLLSVARGRWGYNDICASMHPFWYDVPLSWLSELPPPDTSLEIEWREQVRLYHAKRTPACASPILEKGA